MTRSAPLHRQQVAFWLALVAALALALMPTLSRALAHGQGAGLVAIGEVCHFGSPGPVQDDGGAPAQPGQGLDHCAYCGLATDRHAPLAAAPAVIPTTPAGCTMPARYWHAPEPAHAWQTAQPRAPPRA